MKRHNRRMGIGLQCSYDLHFVPSFRYISVIPYERKSVGITHSDLTRCAVVGFFSLKTNFTATRR